MITQIEIDGFKTFKGFKVELAPFQVIVGPNGSGKSNLFDALHLLSRLTDNDVFSAFQGLRGDAHELFTKLPDGETSNRMRLAVEMLVDRKEVKDSFGKKATPTYTRLRYELEILLDTDEYGLERPYIAHESLKAIPQVKDTWCKEYHLSTQNGWLPAYTDDEVTFIDTDHFLKSAAGENIHDAKMPIITLYYEDQGMKGVSAQLRAKEAERTFLGAQMSAEYTHVFVAREELLSFRFLHLHPEALRQPSSVKSPRFLATDGSNLPTTLARMQAEDKLAFHAVSLDMANLVPGILAVRVEQDKPSNKYVIYAETTDRRSFSSQVFSDGTLRLLALATLRNDPQFHGVLCIEEPENGVHPLHLKNMARLLREMATDLSDPQQRDEPLRQVLVTTHSPAFISQPDVIDALLLALMSTRVGNKNFPSLQITRMIPVIMSDAKPHMETENDTAIKFYTIDMVKKYLDSDSLEKARDRLKEARSSLSKRGKVG